MTGMRTAYHTALESARLDVVRLGALVGDAVHAAVTSLEKRDTPLAASAALLLSSTTSMT